MRLRPRAGLTLSSLLTIGLAMGASLAPRPAFADPPEKADAGTDPKAEVMVIHATKCEKKEVDPGISEAVKKLGFDCLKIVDNKTVALALNRESLTVLPNGRTFQLLHTGRAGSRFKVTASITPADGSRGYVKLADISAAPQEPFNVGGFSHKGGVLLVTVRIIP